jgi:hypothetical protein
MTEPVIDENDTDYMLKTKWVRVMCDHGAEGVWDRLGRCECLEAIPVSIFVREMIMGWQAWYEFSDEDMGDPNYKHFWDVKAFSAMGRCIARKIKEELPDWTVIYHDQEKAENMRPGWDKRSRIEFEYEITMPF